MKITSRRFLIEDSCCKKKGVRQKLNRVESEVDGVQNTRLNGLESEVDGKWGIDHGDFDLPDVVEGGATFRLSELVFPDWNEVCRARVLRQLLA